MIFGQWDAGRARKVRQFTLSPAFIAEFEDKQPNWNPLGYFTFKRTYSRPTCNCLDTKTCPHPSEEYWQTCRRVVEGVFNIQKIHCYNFRLPWQDAKAQRTAQDMFRRMWEFKFTPPGRGYWMMGTEQVYLKGSAALQNCGFCSSEGIDVDFAGPFTFLMDMSMLGVGVGGDMRGAGKARIQTPTLSDDVYVVADTREGWVDLIRTVLNAFAGKNPLPGLIDYRQVRKRGEPIRGFGGIASGAGPLMELVQEILSVLSPEVCPVSVYQDEQWVQQLRIAGTWEPYKITSSQIADLFNLIGKCVVAGGIRRTAEILFGDEDDVEFRNLKDNTDLNQWYATLETLTDEDERLALQEKIAKHPLNNHRWASNNSIFARVGQDYTDAAESVAKNGEPGFYWLDVARQYGRLADPPSNKDRWVMGANPCSEQNLEDRELCNLVETFPAHHDSLEDYKQTLKVAYLYAKTVTLVPTHDPLANQVMTRNRRIGCSMSGIQQAIGKLGRRGFLSWCDQGYAWINELDDIYSRWLGVPRSIKMTSVKPSGTVSLLANATPGIHYAHSEYYIRNVRVAGTSPLIAMCKAAGYVVEPDTYAPDTMVVSFPMKTENFTKGKRDVTIWEQFANVASLQEFWADNMVSCTITFSTSAQVKVLTAEGQYQWRNPAETRPDDEVVLDERGQPVVVRDERGDIAKCLSIYEGKLKSISLLPLSDHGYVQAPYIEIDEQTYNQMTASLLPLDLSGAVRDSEDKFCSGEACELPPAPAP